MKVTSNLDNFDFNREISYIYSNLICRIKKREIMLVESNVDSKLQ